MPDPVLLGQLLAAGDTPERRATSRSEKPSTPRSASSDSAASMRAGRREPW